MTVAEAATALLAVVLSALVIAVRRALKRPRPPPRRDTPTPLPRPSRPSLPPRRILVVDDERSMSTAIVRILAGALPGVDVEQAEGGEEALAMVDAVAVDLLVIDVGLRGISGPEVVRRLRERGRSPRVLLISGLAEEDLDKIAIELDARCLAKPFDAEPLIEVVRELLR